MFGGVSALDGKIKNRELALAETSVAAASGTRCFGQQSPDSLPFRRPAFKASK